MEYLSTRCTWIPGSEGVLKSEEHTLGWEEEGALV